MEYENLALNRPIKSSSPYYGNYAPQNAIDGDLSNDTGFLKDGIGSAFLIIELDKIYPINSINLKQLNWGGYRCKDFSLEISTDNIDYIPIYSSVLKANDDLQAFDLEKKHECKYVKFIILNNYIGYNKSNGIGEIEIFSKNRDRFLLRKGNQFFTIKDEYLINGKYIAIEELTDTMPTLEDFQRYGFDNIELLDDAIEKSHISIEKGDVLYVSNGRNITIERYYGYKTNAELKRIIQKKYNLFYDTNRKIEKRISYISKNDTMRRIVKYNRNTVDTKRIAKVTTKNNIDTNRIVEKVTENIIGFDTVRKVLEENNKLLCTLEEAKQWLGIDLEDTSKDLILNIWIEGVSETIFSMIGRDIMAKDYIEKYPGTNKNAIVLKHYPINQIEEVAKVLDNEVQGLYTIDEIDINKKSGILYRDLAWWKTGGSSLMSGFINFPRRHIRVKYNAGYKKVPADLKLLALQMLGEQYALATSAGTKKGLKSYSISDVKYTWENETKLSQSQLGIINKYKGVRI